MNQDQNLKINMNEITPKIKHNDIRRRFTDDIEIAKEFETPVQTGNIYVEEDEQELLKNYKKRKNEK